MSRDVLRDTDRSRGTSMSSDRNWMRPYLRYAASMLGATVATLAGMNIVIPRESITQRSPLEVSTGPRVAKAECDRPYIDLEPTSVGYAVGLTDRNTCVFEVLSSDPKMNPHLPPQVTLRVPQSDLRDIPPGSIVYITHNANSKYYEELAEVVPDSEVSTHSFPIPSLGQ